MIMLIRYAVNLKHDGMVEAEFYNNISCHPLYPAQAAVAPGPGVAGAGPGHRQPLQQRLQPGMGRQGRDRGHQGGFILLLFVTY